MVYPADTASAAPVVVLDTNAWLDVYLFRDPRAQALAAALHSGALRAVRSDRTDGELRAVLARPQFAAKCSRETADALIAAWEETALRVEPAASAPWTCSDPDDQKFLDLAHGAGAAMLLTRDDALRKLDRQARRAGLQIMCPQDYS